MTKKRKIVLIVVGTRPNIIKITQFKKYNALQSELEFRIVHTGQHYDDKMAASFFQQLRVEPDYFLNVPQVSANAQIAHMLMGLEKVVEQVRPDLLIAVGDVNSTLAAALFANKAGIRLAHLESGLRSFDRTMPEEFNRVVTDELSDWFFVTEQSGYDNLVAEKKPESSIFFTGNTMIDTLVTFDQEIRQSKVLEEMQLQPGRFILMTMHRPSNVDSREGLMKIADLIAACSVDQAVVFPVHPRTLARMKEFGLTPTGTGEHRVILTEPKDYFTFQQLVASCSRVITDSGGVQEETTFRGVPCFTLRPNTERPSTILEGTNQLVSFGDAKTAYEKICSQPPPAGRRVPKFWDGKATERVVDALTQIL